MNTAQLKKFCGRFPAASKRLHEHPSNVLAYSVGGKHFAYFKTSEPERWRFSLWVGPEQFVALTDVPGIKPARYMGRYHWITIVDVQRMPAPFLKALVAGSYDKALRSLSRAGRTEILQNTAAAQKSKTALNAAKRVISER